MFALGQAVEQTGARSSLDPRPALQRASARAEEISPGAELAFYLRGMIKRIARREGRRATFMPERDADSAGSGLHLHHSAWSDLLLGRKPVGEGFELSGRVAAPLGRGRDHRRAEAQLLSLTPALHLCSDHGELGL
jgi:glutamine synthetase